MDKCYFDRCSNECKWIHVKDGRVIGYYCDIHMSYLAMNEDAVNNGLYRDSRWFRIGEFREKNLKEVLDREGGEATVERVAYLLGRSINDVLYIAEIENIKIVREKYSNQYITLLSLCMSGVSLKA